jgi:hypothetical protein
MVLFGTSTIACIDDMIQGLCDTFMTSKHEKPSGEYLGLICDE